MPIRCLGRIMVWMSMAGCLSYDGFTTQVIDKKCDEDARCATAGPTGDCTLYRVPGDTVCDFDADQAAQCLRNEWVCNTDQPGFEFAEPPLACDFVCVRAEP